METVCDANTLVVQPQLSADEAKTKLNNASIEETFHAGELRLALDATYHELPSSVNNPERALQLWYIRVQSLLILQYKLEATKEITRNLAPLSESSEIHAQFVETYLTSSAARWQSWRLRLVLVPVHVGRINQAAVQMYYDMSDEARQESQKCTEILRKQWRHGVELAGFYVVSALITLKDFRSAIALVTTQYNTRKSPTYAKLLSTLFLMTGDTLSAHSWMSELPSDSTDRQQLTKLINFADNGTKRPDPVALARVYEGDLAQALSQLSSVGDEFPTKIPELAQQINFQRLQKLVNQTTTK